MAFVLNINTGGNCQRCIICKRRQYWEDNSVGNVYIILSIFSIGGMVWYTEQQHFIPVVTTLSCLWVLIGNDGDQTQLRVAKITDALPPWNNYANTLHIVTCYLTPTIELWLQGLNVAIQYTMQTLFLQFH